MFERTFRTSIAWRKLSKLPQLKPQHKRQNEIKQLLMFTYNIMHHVNNHTDEWNYVWFEAQPRRAIQANFHCALLDEKHFFHFDFNATLLRFFLEDSSLFFEQISIGFRVTLCNSVDTFIGFFFFDNNDNAFWLKRNHFLTTALTFSTTNLESINNCVMSVPMLALFFVTFCSVRYQRNFTDGKIWKKKQQNTESLEHFAIQQ